MSRLYERSGTWYSLIRSSLEEDAARTVLTPIQAQSLMAKLKAGHVFSVPSPDDPDPAGGAFHPKRLEPKLSRDKKKPPCPGRGDLRMGE